MRRILYAFLIYTILGLLSGFYYRELTLAYDFTGDTQLVVVHTHTLILGMFMHLILLPVAKVFKLSSYYLFNWFFIVYNLGVLATIGMMFTKGTYQVMGLTVPDSFAGYAGMGHTILTAGFILLFFLLKNAIIKNPKN
ncbi:MULTISPECIES: DUF2871 domain-containing protein [Staphylococcus]|jgi:hypothetical protein|uniref:DUF2871 domain-containing protein n=1 Tax=Staphylococcus nepalensis TaxID=214473 RepID=A0A291JHL7_9STAP|nr:MULTISPECIES: DUF2871 domain-containing protein [Staphylococcus]VDG66307.1 Protein of uncharacterised function (DUF2871) [Lacrimispora indolis]ATH59374.1 hypothetical protein BJD96_02965 [Staphylococcus nepalensis]ATH64466.1 hypothetical protein BJG89_03310 [Staphylococcus nepalensis]AWI43825.1 hypothetical protein BJG88_03035 [Staphylococcus nepalensis]MBO1205688.1 DUF2871 domain-containing protein [Staphylococcus nepalensis]